jgi:hypothetical protein
VRHLHILCEGQTEEIIARDVIAPYFTSADAYVTWSIFMTKRPAGGPAFKGGLSSWTKLERELQQLLRDSSTTVLTTMLDYYAFPADAPGMADRPWGSPYDRVRHVESALAKAFGDMRFLPNLVLHETEAWVLADCRRLGEVMPVWCLWRRSWTSSSPLRRSARQRSAGDSTQCRVLTASGGVPARPWTPTAVARHQRRRNTARSE